MITTAGTTGLAKLNIRNTDRSLPIVLLRARENVIRRFRPLLASNGFTEQQWRVLRVLDEVGPIDPTDLSERCCVLAPSMTRILRTLESRKLLKRSRHPQDLRKYVITITEPGKRIILDNMTENDRIYKQLEIDFGKVEIESLLDMLERLATIESQ